MNGAKHNPVIMEAAVKLAELLAPAMSADAEAGADGAWSVQNVIDVALLNGLADLERRYLPRSTQQT